jgi:ADP-dependent NAD(P)H-hydrate dehydratase / NAD(P)H-hydrate epimerase
MVKKPMKMLNTAQIKAWDAYTIENEPIASIDLMERASQAFTEIFIQKYAKTFQIKVFCGLGNNGGDGLAIARMLLHEGYDVQIFTIRHSDKNTLEFAINYQRLKHLRAISEIRKPYSFPEIDPQRDIVIDAMFGSGLHKPLEGLPAQLIAHINLSRATVVSVDIPTGLLADAHTQGDAIIKAHHTITFQVPKLAFLLPQSEPFVGYWEVAAIGLHPDYLPIESSFHYLQIADIKPFIKHRFKYSHKGTFGHCLMILGSYGKIGAAILASKAGLKTGAGLMTVHIPSCGYEIMQTALPEVMVSVDSAKDGFSDLPLNLLAQPYAAIGIGCGLGQSPQTLKAFEHLLSFVHQPLVIDADAINMLGSHQELLELLPKNSILTPHPKEFERLTRKTDNEFERLEVLQNFAQVYQVYVVLKGANTAIATPEGDIYFNSTGNQGMATAGSGDVLTGIITGLLAQGYTSKESALLGVYLHGLAGDLALQNNSYESVIATDIIHHIGNGFNYINEAQV